MVNILVVSHSNALAKAVVDLLSEMKTEDFKFDYIGGIENGTAFGNDPMELKAKLDNFDDGDGILIHADMGSSIMSSQMAISMFDEERAKKIKLVNAPFFESILAAVVSNQPNITVEELLAIAESTLNQVKF